MGTCIIQVRIGTADGARASRSVWWAAICARFIFGIHILADYMGKTERNSMGACACIAAAGIAGGKAASGITLTTDKHIDKHENKILVKMNPQECRHGAIDQLASSKHFATTETHNRRCESNFRSKENRVKRQSVVLDGMGQAFRVNSKVLTRVP